MALVSIYTFYCYPHYYMVISVHLHAGNLKNHVKFNHSKENEISCSKCDFATSSRRRLKEHSKQHDSKQMIKCLQCDYTCTSLNALRSHNSIHTSVKPYRCNYCTFTSKQSGSLKKHVQTQHIDKMLAAGKCKKSTTASLGHNLLKENKAARKKVDERRARGNMSCYKRVYDCKECGSSFVREDSLRSHMKQHGQGEVSHYYQNLHCSFYRSAFPCINH